VELLGVNDDREGNETVRLSGVFSLGPNAPPLDPAATGAQVRLWSHVYASPPFDSWSLEIAVPGGWKDTSDAGWTVDETGTMFQYDGGAARVGGVRRMTVKQRKNGTIAVKLAAPKGSLQAARLGEPNNASVAFGPAADACTQTYVNYCTSSNRRRQYVCDEVWQSH
jgi:hypothetical protein